MTDLTEAAQRSGSTPASASSTTAAPRARARTRRRVTVSDVSASPSGSQGDTRSSRSKASTPLKLALVAVDTGALAAAAALAMITVWTAVPAETELLLAAVATITSLVMLRHEGLYLARVSSVRVLEARGLLRTSAVGALAFGMAAASLDTVLGLPSVVAYGALAFLFLVVGRTGYRAWLAGRRRAGAHTRSIVLVGDNAEAEAFQQVLEDHPELGYRVDGVVGTGFRGCNGAAATEAAAIRSIRGAGASGAVVVASALSAEELQQVTRRLLSEGVHVHLSSGLGGIARSRVRPVSLAHESMLYVEPLRLQRWQYIVKRGIDLVGAAVGVFLSLPVLISVAIAIKLEDGGPVFFTQERLGRDGHPFQVWKFRTMSVNAEQELHELRVDNDRDSGPLFKMSSDPRVTRIGGILRATSLDELPQLWNVLTGDMSLVGPRPALEEEVVHFDEELLSRLEVKPGLTGLWQIEARDHPSFNPYRRLDLFYVQNWSLSLDLLILAGTVSHMVVRTIRTLVPSDDGEAGNRPMV